MSWRELGARDGFAPFLMAVPYSMNEAERFLEKTRSPRRIRARDKASAV
jgi:hypothetical protein